LKNEELIQGNMSNLVLISVVIH